MTIPELFALWAPHEEDHGDGAAGEEVGCRRGGWDAGAEEVAPNACDASQSSFEFANVWPEHPFIVGWRRSLDRLGTIASTHGLELWFVAARFRREFEAQTSRVGLSLTQWLVLEATRQIIEEQRDATSQKRVAERLDMNKMTLSQVMRALEGRGFVDRGPCYESPELRVWVTESGHEVLRRARDEIAAAEVLGARQSPAAAVAGRAAGSGTSARRSR